jgi:hypothetical protein
MLGNKNTIDYSILIAELINALEVARTALCNEGIFIDEVGDVLNKAHGINEQLADDNF